MKADLDHLPDKQQDELARIRTILLDEFDAALKRGGGATSDWRRNGQVLKIILFGSYSRSDWVDEPENGYLSDFDLLIIVSHPRLTDIADYWWIAEDRILRDLSIGRTVNLIVHTLPEVNQGLERGEYFWTDIHKDGVTLYELPGHPLAKPRTPDPEEARRLAQEYFDRWMPKMSEAMSGAEFFADRGNSRDAAFMLHQAVERAYICFLLVHTLYFPRSHNLTFLRSLAEDIDHSLASAWHRDRRADRRRFELLKRAYVEARYSDNYDISSHDLVTLKASVEELRRHIERSNRAKLSA
ncbi:HEPN domain-containing protein [Brevundimonas lutea]|uniref:HEPN domain-containing protein n=1 Tax=Brevundimonas lutea TaxID=2293980 RepID=UPI000F017C2A|nr:HEPN domain-containing protein [Brevundimonas lutea]